MMGENYWNDPRCKGNRNRERDPAHDGISFKTEEMDIEDEFELVNSFLFEFCIQPIVLNSLEICKLLSS